LQIDRAARRMKDCLICWFCENARQLNAEGSVGECDAAWDLDEWDP
jgi:hypothetical protein